MSTAFHETHSSATYRHLCAQSCLEEGAEASLLRTHPECFE